MSTALTITEMREQLEAAQKRLASTRTRADAAAKKLQATAVRTGAAYVAAKYTRSARASGQTPFSIGGLTTLQTFAVMGIIGGELIGGDTGDVLTAAGEGCLCAAAAELANT